MSRVIQKRSYDSSFIHADSEFDAYNRPLDYQDLQYLGNDGVPQPGFLSGRVIGFGFVNGICSIDLEMDEGHALSLRFEGEFALRMHQVAGFGSNIRLSTRGAVVIPGGTTTLRYQSGAHVAVETVLNAWENQDPSGHRPRKRARQSQSAAPSHQLTCASGDAWFDTQQSRSRGSQAARDSTTTPPSAFPAVLPTPRHSSISGPSDISRESPVMDDDSGATNALLTALTSSTNGQDDISPDENPPCAHEKATPTRAGRRTERQLNKRKREEKMRRKSEIATQSAQPTAVQEEPPCSQEVEDILRSPTVTEVGEPRPASASLLDTFLPQNVEGFMTSYTPIKDVFINQKESFIGVVNSVRGIEQAAHKDRHWCQKVTLIDPSNLENCGGVLYNENRPVGFTVNIFSQYKSWLPTPAPGDILLVYNAKILTLNDKLTATGYANEVKWAIYQRETRSFAEINFDDAPEHHMAKDNYVEYEYSPSLRLGPEEQVYCEKLAAWWDEVQKQKEAKKGVVQHIGGDPASPPTEGSIVRRPQRTHQLVREVDRDRQQYFDCTVVIIHVAQTNDMTLVYATDFTGNTTGLGLRPVHAEWCPPNLALKTLQIEFYGAEAANFVREKGIAKDQFWTFRNVRLKQGNGDRYLEATVSEVRKAYRFEEGQKATDTHLKDLLTRMNEFEKDNSSPYEFGHKTIAEAEVNGPIVSLFTCTVEILGVPRSPVKGASAKIYVTDYTSRPELKAPLSADLREKYKDAVLMIELEGPQAERAGQLTEGDIIRIQNVRAKTGLDDKITARIDGCDNLIRKMDASSDDLHVVELLKRKNLKGAPKPEPSTGNGKPVHIQVPPTYARPRPAPDPSSKNLIIAQILEAESECPATLQLKARVVDYEPKDISKTIIRECTVCGESVHPDDPQCPVCEAGAEKLKYRFDIIFSLMDSPRPIGDDTLIVNVGADWAALSDLEPETIALDADGIAPIMARRLSKYIWHLKKDSPKLGSEFEFTIERRQSEDGVQYHLLSG